MKSLASNSSSSSSSSLGRNSGGGGASAQLSHTEVAAVRQLIAGYRESAAFLLRSADELENLILQQNWTVRSLSSLPSLCLFLNTYLWTTGYTWSFHNHHYQMFLVQARLRERTNTAPLSFHFHISLMELLVGREEMNRRRGRGTDELPWRWESSSEGHCSDREKLVIGRFCVSLCTSYRFMPSPSISPSLEAPPPCPCKSHWFLMLFFFRRFKGGTTAHQSSRWH